MTQLEVALVVLAVASICAAICLSTDSPLAGALGVVLCLVSAYLAFTAPTEPDTITIIIEHHHSPGGTP